MKTGPKPIPILERMEKFIMRDPNSGCWLWTGAILPIGYGRVGSDKTAGRSISAHRVMYEQMVGPIPNGHEIDHKCRVRACVNPAHMEPVTHAENMRRGNLHRQIRTVCAKGHSLEGSGAYPSKSKRRLCRQCNLEYQMEWRAKRRKERAEIRAN
jgi:hypothetical protein